MFLFHSILKPLFTYFLKTPFSFLVKVPCVLYYPHSLLVIMLFFFFDETLKLWILSLGQKREMGARNSKDENSLTWGTLPVPLVSRKQQMGLAPFHPLLVQPLCPRLAQARRTHAHRAPLPLLTSCSSDLKNGIAQMRMQRHVMKENGKRFRCHFGWKQNGLETDSFSSRLAPKLLKI